MVAALQLNTGNRLWVERKADPMLKILRSTKEKSVIFTLVGRIEGEYLEELIRVMGSEASRPDLVLDMKDVTLVDQSAIRFLARDVDSVTLENCPAYIRDWIAAEKRRKQKARP